MKPGYTEHRILIWGKTYPELSKKYIETVCTAGVLESGKPVRLYPITYRYLNDEQFKLYQWITAGIQKNPNDTVYIEVRPSRSLAMLSHSTSSGSRHTGLPARPY